MPQTRVARKAQTRELLLDTAARLFADKGIAATTTAEIAEAAQVSHGTVFVHFKTRNDLIAEVVSRSLGQAASRVHELSHAGATVRQILEAHLAAIGRDEALYSQLLRERALPPPARNALVGIQSALGEFLAQALARGGAPRVPSWFVFNSWLGLVNHYVANRDLFAPNGSVVERHGAQIVDHFLTLLYPKKDQAT